MLVCDILWPFFLFLLLFLLFQQFVFNLLAKSLSCLPNHPQNPMLRPLLLPLLSPLLNLRLIKNFLEKEELSRCLRLAFLFRFLFFLQKLLLWRIVLRFLRVFIPFWLNQFLLLSLVGSDGARLYRVDLNELPLDDSIAAHRDFVLELPIRMRLFEVFLSLLDLVLSLFLQSLVVQLVMLFEYFVLDFMFFV